MGLKSDDDKKRDGAIGHLPAWQGYVTVKLGVLQLKDQEDGCSDGLFSYNDKKKDAAIGPLLTSMIIPTEEWSGNEVKKTGKLCHKAMLICDPPWQN